MSESLMPHVDLETLLRCGSGASAADGKISCESLFPDHLSTADRDAGDRIPAESFRLPVRDHLDWLDVHGRAFFDRSQSTKAGGRLSAAGGGLQPSASVSSSHRAKKSAASFFVFPKMPDSGELSRRLRRGGSRRPISRFLPKSSGRPVVPPIAEPGSPKVTCIGRVRSIRDRSLHRKKSKRASSGAKPAPTAKKSGFWSPIVAIFRFRRRRSRKSEPEAAAVPAGEEEEEEPKWLSRSAPIGPAAGIGGMKKFASGRRPEAWAADAAETADRSPVWRRRAAAMPPGVAVDGDRGLEDVGPMTV